MAKIIEKNAPNEFKPGDWVISQDSDYIVCVTRVEGDTFIGVVIAAKEESTEQPGYYNNEWNLRMFRVFHGTVDV